MGKGQAVGANRSELVWAVR